MRMPTNPLSPLLGVALLPVRLGLRLAGGIAGSLLDRSAPPAQPVAVQHPIRTTGTPGAKPGPRPKRARRAVAPKPLDDVTLARKVESAIYRGERELKGKVDVNVADGVAFLRGEVQRPEQISGLEKKAAAVPQVKSVENLLHLPETLAQTRTRTPSA
jgi:hypothetical protein